MFYHSPDQKATAERVIREIAGVKMWDDPIVTAVAPEAAFYAAEDYHQDYFNKNPWAGYCPVVIAPKVAKFRKEYREKLKRDFVRTIAAHSSAWLYGTPRFQRGWSTATPFPGNPSPLRYSPRPTSA